MEYRKLGKTGLEVSFVSFGGIPIQRGSQEDATKTIDEIEKRGLNYIDTARGYTVSEAYLGNALKGRREKFYIATKSMSRDYESMKKDIEISLGNLQTDYIDVYQMHNVPVKDIEKVFAEEGAYKALKEAKDAGKIHHIGVTAHTTDALKILVDQYGDRIETIMFPFNIVESQGTEVLKAAKEKGIGTICMKPYAGGNITDVALAMRYIYFSGLMDVAIPGMGSAHEVEMDSSIDFVTPFTKEEEKKCEKIREQLGTVFCRRCGYCAPCSVGIDIPGTFVLANYLNHYEGLQDWAITRYKNSKVKADACIECGLCETRCPYGLSIRAMLKDVVRDFKKVGVE